ncbi:MAG TPA: metalloregulator ArsR/SmtB family transcription factor, partial [Trichococcus flocculiformis]|nr:metalloregulator ArsR/SmtB family transcription factor [Trichococcus flocculiformis]
MDYENYAKVAKALADPKRVKIVDMLSCGAMCACDILEHFDFTQPTLS